MLRNSTLKQGKPLQRKTPMSRGSGFKAPVAGAGLLRVAAIQAKAAFLRSRESRPVKVPKRLKSSRPKMTPIRASAHMQECTLRFPGICNRDPETTVWCHSNRLEDGKGMSLKAPDEEGCYGCSDCHAWLDGGYAGHVPREAIDAQFDAARAASREILRAKGLLTNSETATVAAGAASEQITVE
jgi:hypothetical protein